MKVTFSGKGAFHTSGHINLPIGDFADDDFITMSLGYCDHELGHEQYTNDNFYQLAANRHPFMVRLLNSLDDVHQENRMFADFRGTRISIRKLVELCKIKGVFCLPSKDNHAQVLKGWVLYKGRSELLEQPVVELFQQTDVMMKNLFGDEFYQKCHHILRSDVLNSLGSTEACFNVAEAIWEAFVEWMDEQERKDDDSQEDSDGAEGSDDTDGADDDSQDDSDGAEGSDDTDGADDDSQEDSDGAEGSDDTDGADDDSQEDSDGAEGSDDTDGADDDSQEDSDGAEGARQASVKAKIIEEIEEMSSEDEHAEIIKIIDEMAANSDASVELIEPLGLLKKCETQPKYREKLIDSDCHRLVARMKNPLKRVFHDQNFVNFSHKNRGKSISSTRLAGVAVGNTKVFESESIHRSPNAAVGLLVDSSGSMTFEDMKMANSVAYSLSDTLDSIHGVKSIVGYYPAFENDDYRNQFCGIVKPFEAKANINNFLVCGSGGTPTAEAVCSMTSLLASRAEPRKLLFVITDGDPNCVESTKQAVEEAQAVGVKVFGIGIKRLIAGFDGADFEVINSKDELLNALTKKLKHAFI
ncbi:cobaltochelatase CobT-related protein [Shewanella colwelliana]|nr:VWA domain-containing protein [Shewanella colwelliana]